MFAGCVRPEPGVGEANSAAVDMPEPALRRQSVTVPA